MLETGTANTAETANTRKDEIATARMDYLCATGGISIDGGSDLAARGLRAIGLLPKSDLIDIDELITACESAATIDGGNQIAIWCAAYIDGLAQNGANLKRESAILAFVQNRGYARLAHALRTLKKHSAGTWSETYTHNFRSLKYSIDLARDINDIFGGHRLTTARRRKHSTVD